MEKISTVFERDWEGDRSRVTELVHPGCEWVLDGEGVAQRKFDGTCVMLDEDGAWWARREVKDGKEPPAGFKSMGHDHITLKNIGWEPIAQSPFAKFHAEAVTQRVNETALLAGLAKVPVEVLLGSDVHWEAGTYELCGPKVQGNPEHFEAHVLIRHETAPPYIVPRSYEGIRDTLDGLDVEGFVFKHEDGRRQAKIKGKDFGIRRPS